MKTDNNRTDSKKIKRGQDKSEEVEYIYTPAVEIRLIVGMLFLMAFGLIMIFSASSYSCSISAATNYDSAFYFKNQLRAIVIGIIALVVAVLVARFYIKKNNRKLIFITAIASYIASIGCIFLLKLPGIAINAKGATRWITIGPLQFQVADVVKVLIILFMAGYVNTYQKRMNNRVIIFVLWLAVSVQAILVLAISSNLSTAIILMLMVFTLTFIMSGDTKFHMYFLVTIIVVVTIALVYLSHHLPAQEDVGKYPYQMARIFAWLDPKKYEADGGYQPLQAMYAIGSAGVFGKGLGKGTQKLVNIPEAQNDMIFSIICEELGIVGAILMFMMYAYMLYQMFIVVKESRNLYGSILTIGVMLNIIYQIIVNVCVAVNLLPNTGVSLPFISYGGSAILFTMMEVGIVLGIRLQQTKLGYTRRIAAKR